MAEPILDVYALFGPIPPAGAIPGTDALKANHARHGVAGAIALSTRGIYHSAPAGNRETAKLCASSGGSLLPAAVIDPRLPFIDTSYQGARALCLFPATQNWPVRMASLKLALQGIAAAGTAVPLMLEAMRPGDPTALFEEMQASGYKGPLVLLNIEENTLGEAVALAKASESVCLSTDKLRGLGEIALAVEQLGPDRIVFGSGAIARNALSASLALVRAAGLSAEVQAKIFSGNARRILGTGGAGA